MPWFKVDDTLHSHPKARRAGLHAMGLWTVSGSFAMSYKLDGFVPEWFVLSWPQGRKLADQLVQASKWEPGVKDGLPGWFFHDWADYQPTSEEIEKDREKSRERQRKRRDRLRNGGGNGNDPA